MHTHARKLAQYLIALVICSIAERSAGAELRQGADLVLRGGSVYTVDAIRRWQQCIAIKNGRIIYVGTNDGATQIIGPSTHVLDLRGKMVLPGFHDCHVHLAESGLQFLVYRSPDFSTASKEGAVTFIRGR